MNALCAENAKLRALARRWLDMKFLPDTSMLVLDTREALKE
jgi:hypothetical protein